MDNKDIEEWRDIEGFEGLYQISNHGNLYRVDSGKFLKCESPTALYNLATLCKHNIKYTRTIHRLVAKAFIPNPENKPQVNHKDENKHNNHVSNLEWCDAKYNNNYGTCVQRRASTHKGKKHKPSVHIKLRKKTAQYDRQMNLICVYDSLSIAANETGIDVQHICNCCRKTRRSAGGYYWRYA